MTRDRKAPANTLANTLILAIVIGIAAVSAGDGQRPLNRERAEQPPTRHAGWTTFTNANLVSDMVFDPEGYLWAVGLGGAVRWDPSDGTYIHYTVDHGLVANSVQSVAVAPDSSVWFATFDGGVFRFDGETWTHLSRADGLAHDNVRAVAVAPDGTLWFGFEGAGVSRYVPAD